MNFHTQRKAFENCGETHCVQIIVDEHRNNPQTPIFLLTNDMDAFKDCGRIFEGLFGRKESAFGAVQVDGILNALEHNKATSGQSLLQKWGFEPHFNIATRITEPQSDYDEKQRKKRQKFLDYIESGTLPTQLVDRDAITGEPGMFSDMIKATLELPSQGIATTEWQAAPPTKKSKLLTPLEKWAKKYGDQETGGDNLPVR